MPPRRELMYFFYAAITLWYDRQRYLPGILAVAFSALLIAMQWGLLLGLFMFASVTVDRARAHIWVGGPNVQSADLSWPIPVRHLARLTSQPEVGNAEIYLQQRTAWLRPDGSVELCMIIGTRLEDGSLGAVPELTPDLRIRLEEDGAVVVDESDLDRLGVKEENGFAEIHGHRIKVVGVIRGFRGPAGAHVFCSVETARKLLRLEPSQTSYLLARCRDPAAASAVVQRIRDRYPQMSSFTTEELSYRSRMYWLTKTKGGIALGYAAILGLVVGAIVTGQTLYAATAAQLREYAVLWALGIPVRRMAALVLAQAFWVGVAGIVLALPLIFLLAKGASLLHLTVLLPVWLLATTVIVTLTMALASGLAALRLLQRIEPAVLLR
jgi:putative ABC transport system permease protein